MAATRLNHADFPAHLARYIADRDAALWLGDSKETPPAAVANVATLPWRMVLSEATSPDFIRAAEARSQQDDWRIRAAGFLSVISADSEGLLLPPKSLPLFLLNGRQGGINGEGPLGRQANLRRRLNHIHQLEASRPTLVVIVPAGDPRPLNDLVELWEGGFRSLVTIVTTSDSDLDIVDQWLGSPAAPITVDVCKLTPSDLGTQLENLITRSLAKDRLYVRFKVEENTTISHDITDCELVEQPLLDYYDILNIAALTPRLPTDLTLSQLTSFFDRSTLVWEPFAAGVPWSRLADAEHRLLKALESARVEGPEENSIFYVVSEAGAGGTTAARALAFSAATNGYPTLVAKPNAFAADSSAVETFLHRVMQSITTPKKLDNQEAAIDEPAWLLVFDVSHWHGREAEIRSFLADITRRGRRVVILTVVPEDSDDIRTTRSSQCLGVLRHEISRDEALALGTHLNTFLAPHGRTHTDEQWFAFWDAHRPNIDTPIGSFWIALEFWLKGQLNLGESIQRWMYRQFSDLSCSPQVRSLLLEIATLTVEREGMPEALMPWASKQQLPHSIALDEVRTAAPALGLVRAHSANERFWAFAHVALGRYLLTSVFFDRPMLETVGLGEARDPVHMRLLLLGRIAQRPEIARRPFRELGLDFARRIMKLDRGAAVEFFSHWRDVLAILDAVPSELRDTSRTFNHHIAISRRRVATNDQYFDTSSAEKEQLLRKAIERLKYALSLPRAPEDEPNLNLLNSLALAYHNLADLRQKLGASQTEVRELHTEAIEAARLAQQENSVNSYVLETLARSLLQEADLYPEVAIENAAEALSYIYQAMAQERSETSRQGQLTKLVHGALRFLRTPGAKDRIVAMARQGNPLATLAEAWLVLATDMASSDLELAFSPTQARLALDVLDQAPNPNWMLLRFRYDLMVLAAPRDFDHQLRILDELEGTGYRKPLQLVLERAILLHQCGRHYEGTKLFESLRRELRDFDVIVHVPEHLRWLLVPGGQSRLICNAQVVETGSIRSKARVRDLDNAKVPFIPQDFGTKRMPVGMHFRCTINFGPMGPFAKPAGASTQH